MLAAFNLLCNEQYLSAQYFIVSLYSNTSESDREKSLDLFCFVSREKRFFSSSELAGGVGGRLRRSVGRLFGGRGIFILPLGLRPPLTSMPGSFRGELAAHEWPSSLS